MHPPSSLKALALALAVVHAPLALAEAAGAELDAVTVTGKQNGYLATSVGVGTFRGQSPMDVPATVNVVTRDVIEAQADKTLYDVLRNTAGVTRQQLGGDTFDNLAIRGITLENRTNYRLNGSLPLMNLTEIPLEDKERVEVLKGVSALYYGYTSPAGVVNMVTKRAGRDPVTTLGMMVDSNGTTQLSADVARRFGEQEQFGLRINAVGGALQSSIHGVDGDRELLSAAFDWRVNERLQLKADLEYYHKTITEQAVITLPAAKNGKITLPAIPDPSNRISPDWAKFDATGRNVLLRADYSLSDDWLLTLEGGSSEVDRKRAFSEIKNYNLTTGQGTLAGNRQDGSWTDRSFRVQAFGNETTGPVRHELTVGYAQSNLEQAAVSSDRFSGSQNLYHPVDLPWLPTVGTNYTDAQSAVDKGVYLTDRMVFSPQWQALAGVRYTDYSSDQGSNHYRATKTTPSAALIFKPLPPLSLYASYAEGLEQGDRAPNTASNANEIMPPALSTQKELGLKLETAGGLQFNTALFDIDRAASYTNDSNVFVQDGRERYRGVEVSAQGQLVRNLSLQASAQWLKARFENIGNDLDGKTPENTPKYTASLFAEYSIPAVAGWSVNAGAYYTGERPVNDANQATIGGYTLFGLGTRYVTRLFNKRTSWQLNVDNLADKRYWGATGNNRLSVGTPRTATLTMKIDL